MPNTSSPSDSTIEWAARAGLDADYLSGNAPEPPARTRLLNVLPPDPGFTVRPAELPQEMRALWITRWDYRTPDDIRIIADKAANANFNALLFQVRGNGDAFYASRLEPWAERLSGRLGQDPGWDPLRVAVDEAHARGLELHAWVNVYPAWLGETPPPASQPESMVRRFTGLYNDAWVMWDRNEQPMSLNEHYLWANPGHWAVSDHIEAVGEDIISHYYVDGLHLDNVRYAGWEYSRDPVTADRLAAARALEPGLDRKEWQRRQVSGLVNRLHGVIDRLKPGLLLSAAVWPVYQDRWDWWSSGDGYEGFCQDSLGWLRIGAADAIFPMLYLSSITREDGQYDRLVRDFVSQAQGGAVNAGITCTYSSFEPIGRRIDLARKAGATGQALFSYGHINSKGYWDELRAGPYATRAIVLPPPRARERLAGRL